ncbi:MetQ/NlpA family lipoprotein [Avibacterium paragallinarum]|uniref:Lipoprotein n=1 Tax=Avibacterium paragallinarum TaxID=728 RepID=A0AAE5TJG9_AVIPA|nr:MetQ/NlpA family lipoprotein [Avibacterium paragallinarum]MEE3609802.1 MetQ/NlpA family lipoprotein [Avibacterium paragallinarum]MEE3620878.1 MetQ/NlpA family lipoprotein [Avibacterium paragallinarum]MEE3669800.1 MetQ/NlpA family lipoprotein [Avibacterium paragallinarum]MEE3681339.1 MetQ/NlpA family lipoprotein [Avibacterium paragallinarum]MEE4387111.1 MetQ/NlpA family lipoprotein [Avibacterium paragallinarum]
MNFKKLLTVATLSSVLALTACKDDKKTETAAVQSAPQKIKVGVMSGPEHQVAEIAAKVAKEKYGLDVEFVEFNEYSLPNPAVSNGDLDLNAMQHKPYLDKDSQEHGYKNLVIVGNTFVYPLAGYSKKIKNVNELQDGAIIAVPNDPSNLARALILLEKQGLIKLKDNTNLFATSLDIVENPKNLQIKEVDTSVAARALDDVDLAVVNNTYAGQVGLNTEENGVFVEDKDSPYVNIIVAREDNKDSDAVKNFVKAYQTDEVYQEAVKHFKDGVVKGW